MVGFRVDGPHITKLINYNKNYKGLGMTEKGKKQEETQTGRDGTIILFLYPLIFDTKIPRDKEQYYRPVCVSSCFFSFSVVPLIPCNSY